MSTIASLLLLLLAGTNHHQAVAFTFAFTPSSTTSCNSSRSMAKALEATPTNDHEERKTILDSNSNNTNHDRRNFLAVGLFAAATATATATFPQAANAAAAAKPKTRFVLDEETGDYIEVPNDEGDWQTEWKSRYDQMSKMSKDEIFVAARGAGNIDQKDLASESPASQKRRAFSGCRDKATRAKLDNIREQDCSKRVLEGDYQFVLPALQ